LRVCAPDTINHTRDARRTLDMGDEKPTVVPDPAIGPNDVVSPKPVREIWGEEMTEKEAQERVNALLELINLDKRLERLKALLELTNQDETLRSLHDYAVREQIAALANITAIFPQEEKAVAPPDNLRYVPFEIMQMDYMQTGEQIKMLTDIRFKLLAFVPPIVGGGIALLSSKATITAGDQILTGSVGLLGFVLTLGIVLYDLRNSQLYNANVHRAKVLERILGCITSGDEKLWPTPSTGGGKAYGALQASASAETGGVHTQRARALGSFFGQRIGHDPALSLVTGSRLGHGFFRLSEGSVRALSCCFPTTGPLLTVTVSQHLL
jgi:hypothetical protein